MKTATEFWENFGFDLEELGEAYEKMHLLEETINEFKKKLLEFCYDSKDNYDKLNNATWAGFIVENIDVNSPSFSGTIPVIDFYFSNVREDEQYSPSKDKQFVTQSLINLLNKKGWYVLEKEGKIIIFSSRY